ncbi:MAG TPA: thioredoxin domain-containing protein [Vicinamibacterales bacterium]|nr:thioredoxin domain-containing protein [Vicinamibacterales bacterium]
MNRLARERSPYLLQHAANPVDWFPWGDEAFARAHAEDKPIFLSIGYSTCHWCHVMEHESFENHAIADVLNAQFVSIKVDREERPDVDRVYMTFVQASTGSGGWPMSVWLTPDLKPFYGGTYFPPASKWGRPGFADILREIGRVWKAEREKVVRSAEALTAQMQSLETAAPTVTVPGADALARAVDQFKQSFDARHGGFGDAPKFPRPSELLFLLREHARARAADPSSSDTAARDMVLRTLRAMATGGMRDHVGGGFHRYSVDAAWRVPHFEKMLYDQAQLALAFVEAAQAAPSPGDPFYAEVAEDTLLYVMREMTDPAGGFQSAEDADSLPPESAAGGERKEGAFYLWRAGEIDALFREDADVVKGRFGIMPDGNAPQDPQQEFTGKNLLHVARSVDDLARDTGRSREEIARILSRARVVMFEERLKRPRPHRDDKVLTAWNGLTIAAFARLARVLERPADAGRAAGRPYLDAARRAATFVRDRMWNADTRVLLRRYRDGHAEIPGYAEDYAYLIFGVLELFQADSDPAWFDWAVALQRRQDELFWDDESGGWFSTDGRDASVLVRMKDEYDGAEPTASSMSALNLLWLSHLVDDQTWRERLERTLRLFGSRLERQGRAVPMMAAALSTYLAGVQQIVVVEAPSTPSGGDPGGRVSGSDLSSAVALHYLPFAVTLHVTPENRLALAETLPLMAGLEPVAGRSAVYVCRNFTCRRPATTPEALQEELGSIA